MTGIEMFNVNKKWIAVIGSPRAFGNTAQITDYIIEALRENKEITYS